MSMELQFAPVIEPMVLDFAPAPTASAEFAAAFVGPMGRVEGGLNLIGTLPDMEDLPETANSGDAYIIEGYLIVWTQGGWLNAGPMGGVPGPKGDTGDTGPQGIQGVQGEPGPAGADGAAGADGDSAYAVAVANGFVGTEAEWLASLVGPKGDTGEPGSQGIQGEPGPKGDTGDTGPAGPAGADGATGPAGTTTWAGITDKPAVIAAGADAAAARSAIGLGNVDNTSDANKPVSTAQATAIGASTATNIHAAPSKATPVDADELGITDSAASWGLKKLTFANLKAVLLAYFRGQFREKLTAARTYYVRTDGSDSNNGLSNTSGGAFLTIQKAVDTVAALDVGIYDVTIRCGGVFTSTTVLKSITGSGRVVIRGDADDTLTMSVAVSGLSVNAFEFGPGFQGTYKIQYMAISSASGSGVATGGSGPANVEIANVAFGACGFYHVWAASNQVIDFVGPCSISGGSFAFARSSDSAVVRMNQAFTLTGTPTFASAFVVSERAAGIVATVASFTGSATGNRYQVTLNAYIFVNGAGASFLPGSSAGVASTGGQYA